MILVCLCFVFIVLAHLIGDLETLLQQSLTGKTKQEPSNSQTGWTPSSVSCDVHNSTFAAPSGLNEMFIGFRLWDSLPVYSPVGNGREWLLRIGEVVGVFGNGFTAAGCFIVFRGDLQWRAGSVLGCFKQSHKKVRLLRAGWGAGGLWSDNVKARVSLQR